MKTIKNLKAEEIRKSILQLAIQGKLVKQDPNDEPASELVKRIYEEKNRLIKEGKIKKDKNESHIFKGDDNCYYEKIGKNEPVKLEDLPFDIPENWTWIRFGNLVYIQTGASFKKEEAIQEPKENYVRVLRGGNILPFQFLLKSDDLFIPKGLVSDSILLQKNDLITPAVTSLENIGKVAVINRYLTDVTAGGFVYIFRPNCDLEIVSNIIMDFMSSALFQKLMKDITKKSGQAFYNMNKERLKDIYFPLPPLNEQKRIVDKIETLEPLLQEYEKYESELSNLESTFPEKLKKSILQYAIEGKLVKQDPNDEPASVLLERIKAEKEALIKAGKIKRDKNESIIYQGDDKNYYENINGQILEISVDYEIPSNWAWARLKSVVDIVNGFTPSRTNSDYWNNGNIPWMTVDDINDQGKYFAKTRQQINGKSLNIKSRLVPADSTFICCTSATIGKVAINKIATTSNQQFNGLVIKNKKILLNEYLYIFCSTLKNRLLEIAGITTFPFVSVSKLGDILISLPPIREQEKIIEILNRIVNLL